MVNKFIWHVQQQQQQQQNRSFGYIYTLNIVVSMYLLSCLVLLKQDTRFRSAGSLFNI